MVSNDSRYVAGLVAAIVGIGLAGFTRSAQATLAEVQIAQIFEPPGRGAPSQTTGGGRRGSEQCQTSPRSATTTPQTLDASLVALMPSSNAGLTVSDRPSFFVYIPKSPAKAAEFILEDDTGKQLVRRIIPLTATPTVLRVDVPATTPALIVDRDYFWAFSMICKDQGDLVDPLVSGRVRRVQTNQELQAKLAAASTPLEKVSVYATAGIWYEAVGDLAKLRQQSPNDKALQESWQRLLKSVELEPLALTPLNL